MWGERWGRFGGDLGEIAHLDDDGDAPEEDGGLDVAPSVTREDAAEGGAEDWVGVAGGR